MFWIKRQPPYKFDSIEKKKSKLETETEKEGNVKHENHKPHNEK